jgi:hypothetical protein
MRLFLCAVILLALTISSVTAADFETQPLSPQQWNKVRAAAPRDAKLIGGLTVKSTQHTPEAYYAGVQFTVSGIEDRMLAIFLIWGPPTKPSLIFAVDGAAHEFFGLGYARKTKAPAYLFDPEAKFLDRTLR